VELYSATHSTETASNHRGIKGQGKDEARRKEKSLRGKNSQTTALCPVSQRVDHCQG